ncbi:zinc ribbon domain-containing protein [Bacillus sp. FSL K6-0947]
MEHHVCQSCGMPMTSELFGTEKDGGEESRLLYVLL